MKKTAMVELFAGIVRSGVIECGSCGNVELPADEAKFSVILSHVHVNQNRTSNSNLRCLDRSIFKISISIR